MRIASVGQAVFATTMISLGIVGLLYPDFVPVWNPVPASLPAHQLLIYLSAVISLITGIGLLLKRKAAMAASILLVTLLLWLLLFRLPNFFHAPLFEACWSVFPLIVVVAASLVLYVRFATDWEREHLGFISSKNGTRIARVLYAFSLIFFGVAHFIDLKDTLTLIPTGCLATCSGHTSPAVPSSRRASQCSSAIVHDWQRRSRPCKSDCSCSWCGYPSWLQAPKCLSSGAKQSLTRYYWLALG